MANPRLPMPMRPMPMTATEMRSFAPLTAPVKICVVRAAPAPLMKSLRSVMLLFPSATGLPLMIASKLWGRLQPAPQFMTLSFCNDVYQLIGNYYYFHNLLAFEELLNLIIRQSALLGQLPGRSERDADSAP